MEKVISRISKRGRGRPPGSNRVAVAKWQPKTWKPIYDQIVSLSVMGKTHQEICNIVGKYNTQQISNVLTSDQGMQVKAAMVVRIRDKLNQTIGNRVDNIIDRTVALTTQLLNDEEACKRAPINIIKTGLLVGKAVGRLQPDQPNSGGNVNSGNTTVNHVNQTLNVIGESGIATLVKAMEKSDEARRLNG